MRLVGAAADPLRRERPERSADLLPRLRDALNVVLDAAKFHGDAIKTCAHAGKDIFCEKPLTLTVEEADEVLAVTAKSGVRLQPGHVRRPPADGRLGEDQLKRTSRPGRAPVGWPSS